MKTQNKRTNKYFPSNKLMSLLPLKYDLVKRFTMKETLLHYGAGKTPV